MTIRRAARRLLGSKRRPDAILGVQEGSALAVLSIATELGIRIPDDLLLASCVDTSALATTWPPVTALDLQPRLFGSRIIDLLVLKLAGDPHPTGTVAARLVVRRSTRRRAGARTDLPGTSEARGVLAAGRGAIELSTGPTSHRYGSGATVLRRRR